jgi:dihydrofolate reductase
MRKVVMAFGISLDGYIARKDGAIDWLSMDWDYDWAKFMAQFDCILMGRKSLEHALIMFPTKEGEKPKNPYAGTETYVFSRTWKTCDIEGIELYSGDLGELIAKLKAREGKSIWLYGGGELAKSFLDAGLVDELQIGIVPHLIRTGLPLFPESVGDIPLRLISYEVCKHKKEDNQMLQLVFEVKK